MKLYLTLNYPRTVRDFEERMFLATKVESVTISVDGEPTDITVAGEMVQDRRVKSAVIWWTDVPKDVKAQIGVALSAEMVPLVTAVASIMDELKEN